MPKTQLTPDTLPEYVLSIPRDELTKNGYVYGTQPFDITKLDSLNYAFLPRAWADDKTKGHDDPNKLGKLMPQVLPYFIVRNPEGDILSYRRKGKEVGLLGRYSIGVGGHIDVVDAFNPYQTEYDGDIDIGALYHIDDIIKQGAWRELHEEIGLKLSGDHVHNFHTLIMLDSDATSQVHVAFVADIEAPEHIITSCNPEEFFEVEWVSEEELFQRITTMEYEPWSKELIKHFGQ